MRAAMLTAKYCKTNGMHFKKIIPTSYDSRIFDDNGVPFRFGFLNSNEKRVFNIPTIRTKDNEFTIHTFRDLDFSEGDKVMFDRKTYFIDSISISYFNSSNNVVVKQYFLTLK